MFESLVNYNSKHVEQFSTIKSRREEEEEESPARMNFLWY